MSTKLERSFGIAAIITATDDDGNAFIVGFLGKRLA